MRVHSPAWFAAGICAVVVSGSLMKMVFDINEKLPAEEHFLPVFWYMGKLDKVLKAHRKFYPKSFTPYVALIAFVGMLSFVFVSMHE